MTEFHAFLLFLALIVLCITLLGLRVTYIEQPDASDEIKRLSERIDQLEKQLRDIK